MDARARSQGCRGGVSRASGAKRNETRDPAQKVAKRNFVSDAAFGLAAGSRIFARARKSGLPDLRILKCRSRVNPRSVRSLVRDTMSACPGRVERSGTRPGTQGRRLTLSAFEAGHAIAPAILALRILGEVLLNRQQLDRERAARVELAALIDAALGLAQTGGGGLADGRREFRHRRVEVLRLDDARHQPGDLGL